MTACDVAIVGGGFSGALVAANLARLGPAGLSVRLFEEGDVGRGAAYGSRHDEHLLNTRASAMTAFPDDPDHFVRWLGGRAAPDAFVSRRLYGDYVAELANRALARPGFAAVKERVQALARGVDGTFVLQTAGGRRFAASAVVLATGNALPSSAGFPRAMTSHPGYIADPWRHDYRAVGGHVLLVGSGLTALDVLVALESAGHRGAVHVVSRRGRFPEVHTDGAAPYDVVPALDASDARALVRSFRRHLREAAARGFDWRALVDALRPQCETLWKRLSIVERRRFDRHLRSRWERHRHRAPQQVDAVRARYAAAGRLALYAGRLGGFRDGIATIEPVEGQPFDLRADWIVNCTGPSRVARGAGNPLLAGLLADGVAVPEPLGVGLRAGTDLAVLDAAGNAVTGLWVTGSLARGSRFEATAVPELREMARAVAANALETLARATAPEAAAAPYFCMAMPMGDLSHIFAALPQTGFSSPSPV